MMHYLYENNNNIILKSKCQEKQTIHEQDPILHKKQLQIEKEEQWKRVEEIEDQDEKQTENLMEAQVEQVAQMAMEAVQKEMRYEQLAVKEEQMREKENEKKIMEELENEVERQNCIERELKQKKKEIKDEEIQKQLALKAVAIQQQALQQVKDARKRTYERVQKMRIEAEKKRREIKQQIIEIRTKMASRLLDEAHVGNEEKCDPLQPQELKTQYCYENFQNQLTTLSECKVAGDDFCYICCEHEFGVMHGSQQEQCFDLCDRFLGLTAIQRPVKSLEENKVVEEADAETILQE